MPGISINVIRVGFENFTAADATTINNALTTFTNIYATVGIQVRRIERYRIPLADARGRDVIDNNGEAEALTDEWTVRNNAIDVFFVKLYVGSVAGLSPVPGPCDKNAKGMDGAVVELIGGNTGLVLAHEVGHYLGLSHTTGSSTNLMFPSVPNGGLLTTTQGNRMKSHCFIEP
ncbi:zinc-dependent metalloprotease family protein [Saccharothrix sp.]|uniref:zinc-dependent metalloprotease family protein n=1 Tax=Saccharothrix sp. TaxID=1873460 RepID=UPI002811620A|nr:zinc-dependent metalloprotease family protein [Saccharothrix sp.]